MYFNTIVNPKTGRKASIYSKLGKSILRNYVNHLGGSLRGGAGGNKEKTPKGALVTLVSSEGDKVEVAVSAIAISEFVNTMIYEDEEENMQEIPLPNVNTETLQKIVEFAFTHVEVS